MPTPTEVIIGFWAWFWVIIGVLALLAGIILGGWQAGWWFTQQNTARNYSNIEHSQQYQVALQNQMQQHLENISGPGGLAATRAGLPANSPEQQVLRAQELNELNGFCEESARFIPQDVPGGAQLSVVIAANCQAGVPVASPPLASR